MRTREEVEHNAYNETGSFPSLEANRLLYLIVELLLDIRDQNVSQDKKLWGVYCPQHQGSWLTKTDGTPIYCPSKEVAEAQLESLLSDDLNSHLSRSHFWTVVEFGKQEYVDPRGLPPGSPLCASHIPSSRYL